MRELFIMATIVKATVTPIPKSAISKRATAKTQQEQQHLGTRISDLSSSSISNNASQEADQSVKVKRIPPIKAPVGLAKGPDLKNCKSKVGSLNNIKHIPQSSGVTIQSQKLKWNAKSKVGSLDNKEHKPGGGKLKVESRKLEWKTTSKVQSLANVNHKPGGGNFKIFNEVYVEKPTSKLGSRAGDEKTLVSELKDLTLKDK